jgi:two-component system CheB/CheR fusion protein
MQSASVHDLLHHTAEVCASDIHAKRLNLRFELGAASDHITADPARLQQVFWNLLSNAIKFSPPSAAISLRTANPSPSRIRIEIQDAGVGIALDMVSRVFDAFEQGNTGVTRQFGGLGLGLAISKAVIDMHAGTIHAQSPGPGQGATFLVELATTQQPAPLTPSTLPASPHNETTHPRILLVEDHPDTAKMLSRLLIHAGYQVKTAHSVADALRLASSHPFDILVSDIGLPDATGYDLMRQLRDLYGIKGIALSGYGMEEDLRRGYEAGFIGYVVKPVNISHLHSVIRNITHPSSTPLPTH